MEIRLERQAGRGGRPVYRQIADQIRQGLAGGRLRDGERLPPIRTLASRLGVNRDTVGLAYESLAAEGLVEAVVGRGTFVRASQPAPGEGFFEPSYAGPVERLLEFERARPNYGDARDAVPLHALIPDPALFPVEPFRRALNRALADGGAALLGYGGPQGHAGLRGILAEWLRGYGIPVGADELVICHGASQGISLALRLFAEPGDMVAVEEPTYNNVLGTLVGLGLRPAPVPMTEEGVDLEALDRTLARQDVKLFYTIPTFHNPMGTSMPIAHRRRLLEVAKRHATPVIEDAFEMDLCFEGRSAPALAALDDAGIVVHLFSFSKSLFPGSRVGSILARGRGGEGLLALKHASDLAGPLPLQAAMADFVRNGGYERHLNRLRKVLRARRDATLETLERCMPAGTQWTKPTGGLQLWVDLPEPIDTRDLLPDAMRAGVLFAPGYQFHHDGRRSRGLRLSLALADEAAIRRGVEVLGRVVGERLAAAPSRSGVPVSQ